MKHQQFIRPLTLNERLYAAGEYLAPPFALTYVVEGQGYISDDAFVAAVAKVNEALPVLSFGRKGSGWFANQHPPLVHCMKEPLEENWEKAAFHTSLSKEVAAFYLYGGTTIVVRILHRLMDAKGVQGVLRVLFAALRGEELVPQDEFPADFAVRAQLDSGGSPKRGGYGFRWPSLRLLANSPASFQTKVLQLNQRWEAPLAKIAALIAEHVQERCRFLIPVDVRRHEGVPMANANLSLPIYLEVEPGRSWQEVQAHLLSLLQQKAELAPEPMESLARRLPLGWLQRLMNFAVGIAKKKQRFPMSGFLSDNGFVDLKTYQTSSFEAKQVIAFPVFVPLAPICLVAIHHQGGTNVAIQLPETEEANQLLMAIQYMVEEKEVLQAREQEETAPLETWLVPISEIWGRYLQQEATSISPTAHFADLGGDSLQLLAMLSEISTAYVPNQPTAFMQAVLDTGGRIHLRALGELIQQYSDNRNANP